MSENQPGPQESLQPAAQAADALPAKKARRKKKRLPGIVSTLIVLAIAAVGVYVVLYLAAMLTGYATISDLLLRLREQFAIILERVMS